MSDFKVGDLVIIKTKGKNNATYKKTYKQDFKTR